MLASRLAVSRPFHSGWGKQRKPCLARIPSASLPPSPRKPWLVKSSRSTTFVPLCATVRPSPPIWSPNSSRHSDRKQAANERSPRGLEPTPYCRSGRRNHPMLRCEVLGTVFGQPQAFRAHPRIGESPAKLNVSPESQSWSRQEQGQVTTADATVKTELAEANRAYEQRFGHIFIVCATGKSASEILAILRRRMQNDGNTELHEAAEEQRQITQLRLKKWLGV